MKITTARRIAQIFFFTLFAWFAVVASVGTAWWQWRGWPVRWFLQLDPLVALGTVLTTHSFHPLLGWSLVTIAVTIVFGRVFCGFVCPFGAIHQFVGWLGRRRAPAKASIAGNAYRPAQAFKYYVLIALLTAAAGNLIPELIRATRASAAMALGVLLLALLVIFGIALQRAVRRPRVALLVAGVIALAWLALAMTLSVEQVRWATLQTGWLDPIPLLYRSFIVAVLPLTDAAFGALHPTGRWYVGSALIGALFTALVLANLWIPRFFCRILCPLGALLAVIGRGTAWSIGKTTAACNDCGLCDVDCEGACNPAGPIRVGECLLCMNCLDTCPKTAPLSYQPRPSPGGELPAPAVSRRGFMAALATGLVAAPLARLAGNTRANWSPGLIRPPGAVPEPEFLARCLKCTACLRVCPTNTLQPAGFEHGWEAVWTPVLNNRIGTSGCQLACVACGHACPTGAIRPLTLAEKHGTGEFAAGGPIRIGLAAVDRGRCLPWANDRPCIVCEENCPVTPKAITIAVTDSCVEPALRVSAIRETVVTVAGATLEPGRYATGDYRARLSGEEALRRIVGNTADTITLETPARAVAGDTAASLSLYVHLQRPVVDPARCIGCGVCEHECPMSGLRAIRVTADNETRGGTHRVLLERKSERA